MRKKVNYNELLELLDLEIIKKYEMMFTATRVAVMLGTNYVGLPLQNIEKFEETETVVIITTREFALILWKNVAFIHLTVF